MARKMDSNLISEMVTGIISFCAKKVESPIDLIDVLIFSLMSVPKLTDMTPEQLSEYVISKFNDRELMALSADGVTVVKAHDE